MRHMLINLVAQRALQVVDNIEKSDGGNGGFDEIGASETIDKLVSGCQQFNKLILFYNIDMI